MRSKTTLVNGVTSAIEQVFGIRKHTAMNAIMGLTPREYEVANLMAQGMTNVAIAAKLVISPKTLDIHRQNVCKKLGVPAIGVPRIILAGQILDLLETPLDMVATHGA